MTSLLVFRSEEQPTNGQVTLAITQSAAAMDLVTEIEHAAHAQEESST